MSSTNTVKSDTDVEAGKAGPVSLSQRAWSYLQAQVNSKECVSVSIYACFLTGFTSAISFSVSLKKIMLGRLRDKNHLTNSPP